MASHFYVSVAPPAPAPAPAAPATPAARTRAARLTYYALYRHVPAYILTMLLVYVGMFVITQTVPGGMPLDARDAPFEPLILDTAVPREAWRLYTYSFLHSDVAHLVCNGVLLLFMGGMLNVAHGQLRIALLHNLGALCGALGVYWQLRAQPHRGPLRVVGASGTVYALIGAHAGNVALNWGEMPDRWVRVILMAGMVATDVCMYVFQYNAVTSYSAHLAGFVSGVLLSPLALVNMRALKWERVLQGACAALAAGGLFASIVNYLLFV